jgi:hypothetical protein
MQQWEQRSCRGVEGYQELGGMDVCLGRGRDGGTREMAMAMDQGAGRQNGMPERR